MPVKTVEPLGEYIWPYAEEQALDERFIAVPFSWEPLSANTSDSKTYRISTGWDFIMSIINSYSDGAFKLQIRDDYATEELFISPTRGTVITGDGRYPFMMLKTHLFRRGTSVTVTVEDLSGSNNNIQIALIGHKRRAGVPVKTPESKEIEVPVPGEKIIALGESEKYKIERFSTISFSFDMSGSAGDTFSAKQPISTAFDFIWDILNVHPLPTYTGNERDFKIQLRDEKIAEDFFDEPIRNTIIGGNGKQSFALPRPQVLQAGTTVTCTITDINGGASTPVEVVMIGYKAKKL